MKYTEKNPPLVCMATQCQCYKSNKKMTIRGVLWHSTGANNPTLKRYVQPSEDDPNKEKLLSIIGVNPNRNHHNKVTNNTAGLNAWIGKLADGSIGSDKKPIYLDETDGFKALDATIGSRPTALPDTFQNVYLKNGEITGGQKITISTSGPEPTPGEIGDL